MKRYQRYVIDGRAGHTGRLIPNGNWTHSSKWHASDESDNCDSHILPHFMFKPAQHSTLNHTFPRYTSLPLQPDTKITTTKPSPITFLYKRNRKLVPHHLPISNLRVATAR